MVAKHDASRWERRLSTWRPDLNMGQHVDRLHDHGCWHTFFFTFFFFLRKSSVTNGRVPEVWYGFST